MMKQGVKTVRVAVAAGLLTTALAMAPARASHGNDYIAPLAAFITLGAILHHSQHGHRHYGGQHYYHRPHHGHHGHHGRHSHSHGGYYQPRHKRHQNW